MIDDLRIDLFIGTLDQGFNDRINESVIESLNQ